VNNAIQRYYFEVHNDTSSEKRASIQRARSLIPNRNSQAASSFFNWAIKTSVSWYVRDNW